MLLYNLLTCLAFLFTTRTIAGQRLGLHINSGRDYCLILPSWRNTIGGSEDGGAGAKAFCKFPGQGQGQLPSKADGWRDGPHFLRQNGYAQITGCIKPQAFSTLIPSDDGGQYDSKGGNGGRGNPPGSYCEGYSSYVEVVEPSSGRVCIRCCQNDGDCPLQFDTDGCQRVISNGVYNC